MMGVLGLTCYVANLVIIGFGLAPSLQRSDVVQAVPSSAFAMVVGLAILSISYEVRNEMLIGLLFAVCWFRVGRVTRSREIDQVREPSFDVTPPSKGRALARPCKPAPQARCS
jgi:hypothetical protein